MTDSVQREESDFRVLIVYPNLPLMLVPGIAIGIFTRIFKDLGFSVDMFDTTHFDTNETNYSETKINYSENRVQLLNARKFDVKSDLGIAVKSDMLGEFRKKVLEFKPDFMILSVVEDTFLQACSMLEAIEDLSVPHLVGGVFPTMAPEIAIAADPVRVIGVGEGETMVAAAAKAIQIGKPLENIPGTWRKDQDGSIIKVAASPLVDINNVTPDYSLFDAARFNRPMGGRVFRMMPVETYRGCPYSCTYCNSPTQRLLSKNDGLGNFMRRKTMDNLRNELANLIDKFDPDFFMFMDDSFLARPRNEIFEFCDMYEEFKLPFYFNTRTENCEPDTLARLKEVGCYRMAFGIEAGNEQFRQQVLRRKITNAEIIRRFNMIADSGIAFSINLIIGMPGETRELIMDTIELARSIRGYDTITSFIFTPYHGTPLRTTAVENDWLKSSTITKHNTSRSLLKMPPPYLSADEIDGLLAVLPLYVYFPKSEWGNLRRAETDDEEGLQIRQHYVNIYTENFLGETQDVQKIYLPEDERSGGFGLKNPFTTSPSHMSENEIRRLVDPMIGL